jgi:23S rRNA (guanosine2251-2'-O)-methyltransferase
MEQKNKQVVLIAHDIRSAHNVGAFFRTADGAGVEKIFLTGYTPLPASKKFMLTTAEKQIQKTALGAEKTMLWEKRELLSELLSELKRDGYMLYALEQDDKSVVYDQYPEAQKIALLVGNEVDGVPESLLEQADAILEIPMRGSKNSLNVSVATGVVLYELLKEK